MARSVRRQFAAPALAGVLLSAAVIGAPASVARAGVSADAPTFAVPAQGEPVTLPAGTVVGGSALASKDVVTDLAAGTPAPPVPKAVGWLVADLDTRQIIAARRVHTPLAPASTMKIFTALALAPTLDPADLYIASPQSTEVDGTKVGLVRGSRYTVDQLLHGLIMSSGNDTAVALGELAGGQPKAVGLMQASARELGAFDTNVRTTSGLDAPGQTSSAYDLALAGSAALADPQLAKIMRTRAFDFPAAGKGLGKTRKQYSIQTHNKLIYNTPGATGVKNGYTIAARGSFVGSATRNGHSYIAVVLRTEGSTWHAIDDLLEWAFAHGDAASPVGSLITPSDASALLAGPKIDAARGDGAREAAGQLRGAEPAAASASGTSFDRTTLALISVLVLGVLLAVVAGRVILRPSPRRPSPARSRSLYEETTNGRRH